MQGIFVGYARPKTKKAVKEAVATDAWKVRLEATSFFDGEYDGPVAEAPPGTYNFVGPDPRTSRKFYGSIVVSVDGRITVK